MYLVESHTHSEEGDASTLHTCMLARPGLVSHGSRWMDGDQVRLSREARSSSTPLPPQLFLASDL